MKKRFVVTCNRHGVESKDWDGKQVLVSEPKNKKDRNNSGCPYCAAEQRAEQNEPAEQSA